MSSYNELRRNLIQQADLASEVECARDRIWKRYGSATGLRGHLDWMRSSVALQVSSLERLAELRLRDSTVTGHSTMNGQIQSALAATTFKSLKTTSTAFGGDMKASITHIIECLSRDSGKKSDVALNALTSAPAHLAARVLAESVGERMLCWESLLGHLNPDLVAECSDNAMDILWPRVKDMDFHQMADLRWLHVFAGLCVLGEVLKNSESTVLKLNKMLH